MTKIESAQVKVRKGRTVAPATRTLSTEDVFSRVSKPGEITHLKGALFGPPKTGKTRSATNTTGKVLLVLTEPEGDLAIRDRKNVDVFRPEHWKDLNDVTSALKGKDHGYDTAVYDSVTFMFELVGNAAIAKTFRENKDIRRPYGDAGAAINQVIFNAMGLDMNVIFTAQLKTEGGEDEDSIPLDPNEGKYPVSLAVTPMVYKVLSPAVSFIGRTFKEQAYEEVGNGKGRKRVVKYGVSFEDFGRSPAGNRLGLPEKVYDLDLDTLLAAIKEGKES